MSPSTRSRPTLIAAAAMAFAVTACGGSGGAPTASATESSAPAVQSAEALGQALFAKTGKDCVQCHATPATLRRGAADATAMADRIQAAIAANTGRMGESLYGFANMTRAELLDLGAYLVAAGPSAPPSTPPVSPPIQPTTAVQCSSTGSSSANTQVFASGLSSPWGMAFLPDNRVLVTQKSGSMVLVSADGASRTALTWGSPAPQISDRGQGGLLDVALDPDFATTPWVYFTYSEPGANSSAGTSVGRASLQGSTLVNFQRLYQQTPKLDSSDIHFGSRLAFRSDKTLFVSLGDRGYEDPSRTTAVFTQSAANSVGKLIRINRDGSIPPGNPFQGQPGALAEVWSIGHRNPQGLTYDAATDTLWNAEHGPQGGDEVNRVQPGANYGWPLRSYGCPYGSPQGPACRVGGGVHLPLNGTTFTEPLTFWAPTSMAPSNMIVYRGSVFPEWNGQLFVGGLGGRLWRIALNNGAYASCEGLPVNLRVRDVRQGPDGGLWLLTDSGDIRRLVR